MKNIATSSGRLFSVSIKGSPATVKDIMVAGHVYLASLENQFSTSQQLLACHRSWEESEVKKPGEMNDDQFERAQRWVHAHDRAALIGRQWLSAADTQSFVLRLAAT